MTFGIFTVIRTQGATFPTPKQHLVNLNRLRVPTRVSDFVTQVLFDGSTRFGAFPLQGWQIAGNFETIQNSLAGTSPTEASIVITPGYIDDVANSNPVGVYLGDILYAIVNPSNSSNVDLYVSNPNNALGTLKYTLTSTTLNEQLVALNGSVSNLDFTGAFTSCTTNTQVFTYAINLDSTLQLQVNKGEGWIPVANSSALSAGSGSVTFNFQAGDIILNDPMQVIATTTVGGNVVTVAVAQFTCTGGTASGSGTPGDCTMYAYFDGIGWNDTLKTINFGNTCTTGYHCQISTSSDFTDTAKIVRDFNTTSNIEAIPDLAAGTYYARVQNLAGQTAYSSTITFTNT